MSEVGIINTALVRLRVKQRLANLTDTEIGRTAADVYPFVRDRLLAAYNWGFARRTEALAVLSGTPPIGWSYQYALPADCLIVRRVVDEGGSRYVGRAWYPDDINLMVPKYPWQIVNTAAGRALVCDLSPAYAIMTFRVTDVNEYPPGFRDALAWWVALELSSALNVDDDVSAKVERWAPQSAAVAFAQDGNQMLADPAPESPTVRVRG